MQLPFKSYRKDKSYKLYRYYLLYLATFTAGLISSCGFKLLSTVFRFNLNDPFRIYFILFFYSFREGMLVRSLSTLSGKS